MPFLRMIKKIPHEEIPRFSLGEVLNQPRHPVKVMVHNIRSLYNVGSVFRTADSAGIAEVILCGYTGAPPRKEIEKTALGSTQSVRWRYHASIFDAIAEEKAAGYRIGALEIARPSLSFNDLEREHFPMVLVLGNEITGVDDDVLASCDFALEIPQFGYKQSLNVAVAFGVGVYGVVDRYRTLFPGERPPIPFQPPVDAGDTSSDAD